MSKITFGKFKTDITAQIFPQGGAKSLRAAHDKAFLDAIVDLQRWIPCLQQNNVTIHPFCSTYFECGKTVVPAPRGVVRRIYTIVNDQWCDYVVYRHTEKEVVRCWSSNLLRITSPTDNPLLPVLPLGFRNANPSTDSVCGRSRDGIFAIHNEQLLIAPWIQSNESVIVEWDGIKRDWTDADLIADEPDLKKAVGLFVQMSHERDFGCDPNKYLMLRAEYETQRADLIFQCREDTRVRETKEASCGDQNRFPTADEIANDSDAAPEKQDEIVTFGVIGNYGSQTSTADSVAAMLIAKEPEFIIGTGNGWAGALSLTDLDLSTGKNWHAYLFPYTGVYGETADRQNFYAAMGVQERVPPTRLPLSLAYYGLPKPYYDVVRGPVHFFILDSGLDANGNNQQADGITSGSKQAQWLQAAMALSVSPWKVIVLHHPPYSSTTSYSQLRWAFKEMGAHLVLSGHASSYERLTVDDLTYLVVGSSGEPLDSSGITLGQSEDRYNEKNGAVLVTATCDKITAKFFDVDGTEQDSVEVEK